VAEIGIGLSGLASSNEDDLVPWTAIINAGQEVYIAGEYLPVDYLFMEPTRIKMDAGVALLDFWRERERNGWVAVEFHNYLGADGKVRQAERFASVVHEEAKNRIEGDHSAVQGKGKGKGKAAVKVPMTRRKARNQPITPGGEDGNDAGIFKVPRPKPKRKARRQEVSPEHHDGDSSSAEDFTAAVNNIDSDEAEHGGPSHHSKVVPKPPGTSPADVGESPDARKKYLQNLSTVQEYQAMLDAIYSLVVSRCTM